MNDVVVSVKIVFVVIVIVVIVFVVVLFGLIIFIIFVLVIIPVMAAVAVSKKVVSIGHFLPCFCLLGLQSFLFV